MPKIGLWLSTPEPLIAEAAARAKPDWVGLDLQHGGWDLGTAFRGIQLLDALGMPAIVARLRAGARADAPPARPRRFGRRDRHGLLVELVEEAVRRARYQPEGVRSYGGQRYGLRHAPSDPAEIRPRVYPMIEDRRGMADVAKIARVKGIAGLHIGPFDLGLGLGVSREDPRFARALQSILDAGHAAGVPVTMHAVRPEEAAGWFKTGFDEVVLTADIELIRSAFQSGVELVRRETAG